MLFKGFEVKPLGNAELSINEQGNLLVSNIGDSGFDGYMVNVVGRNNVKIFYNEITGIANNGAIRHSTLSKNPINQVVTTSEDCTWYDKNEDCAKTGHNMSLMPSQFTLFGSLNGERVFEIVKQNPTYPSIMPGEAVMAIIALCISVATLAVTVYQALKPSHYEGWTYDYNAKGRCVGKHWTKIDDPEPFEIIVDGKTYTVDQYGIEYAEIPEDPNYYEIVTTPIAVQMTGVNLDSVEITDIV